MMLPLPGGIGGKAGLSQGLCGGVLKACHMGLMGLPSPAAFRWCPNLEQFKNVFWLASRPSVVRDIRMGDIQRWCLGPLGDYGMRVPDEVRKCVVFVGLPQQQLDGSVQLQLRGTAFFVAIAYKKNPHKLFVYLVTAKHVAEKITGQKFSIRANKIKGPSMLVTGQIAKWWNHPTEENVDVSVFPWAPPQDLIDYRTVQTTIFLTKDIIKEKNIGVGDEVFITGLFAHHFGRESNVSIIRMGNIAMMPNDPVETKRGPMEAYLIEARSIAGVSGSPVFARETQLVNLGEGLSGPGPLLGLGGFYLLGLMHGHWDLPLGGISDDVALDMSGQSSVNIGIAIVVPAGKILEVLNHPELVELRERQEQEDAEKSSPVQDTGNGQNQAGAKS